MKTASVMSISRALLFFILCLGTVPVAAQKSKAKSKFVFGDVKTEDFTPSFYPVDSLAGAVYLFDVGSSEYEGNHKGGLSVGFQKQTRIRLLTKNSFNDLATVRISMGTDEDDPEKLDNFQAATYNIDNGKVVVTKVDKASIFKEKENGYQVLKFTFPNIKEGSIIEYTFKIISPYDRYLESWTFQGDYPKLWSEYTVNVPQIYNFITSKQGYLQYDVDATETYKDHFLIQDFDRPDVAGSSQSLSFFALVYKHNWAMKNVPAMKKEAYIRSLNNYVSKISFQLYEINYLDGTTKLYMKNWNGMAATLMAAQNFGYFLTDDLSWLKDDIKAADANGLNLLTNAMNIYAYVQKKFNSVGSYGFRLSQSFRTTDLQKKGTSADLNLFLIALLKAADFEVNPVLLSTREHGKPNDNYPIMNQFNYVIAQVKINGKTYLLDAANKFIAFGKLGNECYNGNARLVSSDPYAINLSADSLKETSRTEVSLLNDGPNKVSGTYSSQFGEMQSLDLRQTISKENKEDFLKELKKNYSDEINIENMVIDSLQLLSERVTLKFDLGKKFEEDIVYFNPMIGKAQKENPFAAAERVYPVEMPYAADDTYVFNMEVPNGYKVDELPKTAKIDFNGNQGSFEYTIAESAGVIQMRCHLVFNKANFESKDYKKLRDFYSIVVQKESEQIVFKKIQ